MTKRLRPWIFIALAVLVMGAVLAPMLRVALGIDESFQVGFFATITILIGGLMLALTGMILLARKPQPLPTQIVADDPIRFRRRAALIHLSGLLLFTGIPLLHFLVCYHLWVTGRAESTWLDHNGREAINFQIATALYIMISLFMAYMLIGVLMVLALLVFIFTSTLIAAYWAWTGRAFRYPASFAVISRAMPS